MSIDISQVSNIARLARLELDQETQELFVRQLTDILAYMETLNELDTSNVEPLYSPVSHAAPLREDEPETGNSREDVLGNAPESDGRHFIVPKVVFS